MRLFFWGFHFSSGIMVDDEIFLRKAHRMKQIFSRFFPSTQFRSFRGDANGRSHFFLKQHVSDQTYSGLGKNIHSFSPVSPNPFPISPSILNRISNPRIFFPLKFQHNFWSPRSTKNKGPGTDEGTTSQRFISAFPSVVGCWRIQQLQVQWTPAHTIPRFFLCTSYETTCHATADLCLPSFQWLPPQATHPLSGDHFGFWTFPPRIFNQQSLNTA